MMIAALITIVGFSMLLFFAINNYMAISIGPGRHRRRRISLPTMIGGVGLWEILIGVDLVLLGDTVSAVGPIGLGLAMLAVPLFARRFRGMEQR